MLGLIVVGMGLVWGVADMVNVRSFGFVVILNISANRRRIGLVVVQRDDGSNGAHRGMVFIWITWVWGVSFANIGVVSNVFGHGRS